MKYYKFLEYLSISNNKKVIKSIIYYFRPRNDYIKQMGVDNDV